MENEEKNTEKSTSKRRRRNVNYKKKEESTKQEVKEVKEQKNEIPTPKSSVVDLSKKSENKKAPINKQVYKRINYKPNVINL